MRNIEYFHEWVLSNFARLLVLWIIKISFENSAAFMSDSSIPKSSSSRINYALLTDKNIGTVKKLNSVLFPIKYSDKFYRDILAPEVADFCQLGPSLSSDRVSIPLHETNFFQSITTMSLWASFAASSTTRIFI